MVIRNVPMYQARIPIGGGGGLRHIDLRERAEPNPIVMALQQIVEQKRQREQDELNRRIAESQIGLRGAQTEALGREKQRQGRLAKVGDKWGFISETGEFQPIPMPPPSAVKLLEEYARGTKAAAGIEEAGTRMPPEVLDAILKPMEKGVLERGGYEEVEVPGEKRSRFGIDWLARDIPPRKEIRPRKKVVSKEKERPPKPKEYPDAKWSEEHQMWTIVKNGRLMGVK